MILPGETLSPGDYVHCVGVASLLATCSSEVGGETRMLIREALEEFTARTDHRFEIQVLSKRGDIALEPREAL